MEFVESSGYAHGFSPPIFTAIPSGMSGLSACGFVGSVFQTKSSSESESPSKSVSGLPGSVWWRNTSSTVDIPSPSRSVRTASNGSMRAKRSDVTDFDSWPRHRAPPPHETPTVTFEITSSASAERS